MKNFDDILKNGKDKVKEPVTTVKPYSWGENISILMNTLQCLNEMYEHNDIHNFKIEQVNCEKCSMASFVITTKDISDIKKVVRFHHSEWKSAGKVIYYCGLCKKAK